MPRAEAGSMKHLSNQMKSKGLQRLRFWCQACSKQCRDANGFKCHATSESHIRQMQAIGEDPRKYINNFSTDFQRDFIALLRTAHGEKWIGANKFYNEYIRDKEHIHMNATKWSSLTEFVKHLGREGVVHVKEDEKDGLMIAWRDTSMAALKRREDIQAQEAREARNEAGEDKMLKRMAQRAKQEAEAKAKLAEAKKAQEKSLPSPPAEDTSPEGTSTKVKSDAAPNAEEAPKPDAAPAKISFGLKAKAAPNGKPGLGQMKSQSIFKRARENSDEKPKKKVKL
ncbi:domain of Kin17 curved DNA-binding protein-domain-containing protein [Lophiotrema nucula]|uniref:Domain of Kin17 curved DNA-binding protein-domain-containing protein n=1 Tax=Lophiotrema nucula TaxID=690887 RepID=A0A6A5ZNK8_9PLEO|nr:domain of Kin17 curved DNA-binding protein-domain-containing protein [Lophiotrema nucula]